MAKHRKLRGRGSQYTLLGRSRHDRRYGGASANVFVLNKGDRTEKGFEQVRIEVDLRRISREILGFAGAVHRGRREI